jgi:hypothetical protein
MHGRCGEYCYVGEIRNYRLSVEENEEIRGSHQLAVYLGHSYGIVMPQPAWRALLLYKSTRQNADIASLQLKGTVAVEFFVSVFFIYIKLFL